MKHFSKRDWLLLVVILILCIVVLGIYFFYPKQTADYVEITVDGKLYKQSLLDKDYSIKIIKDGKTTNILEIKDGQIFMKEADCSDHLCIKQGKIRYAGESIVCLPQKVVVQVKTKQAAVYDSMTK